MKANQSFLCAFGAILYCAVQSCATKEVLLDSGWSPETSWKSSGEHEKKEAQYGWSSFEEYKPSNHAQGIWHEQIIKTAIEKALSNNNMRQYILKSMPTLRDLTQEQMLALSALISAKAKSKPDHQVKFEKVAHMFGIDQELVMSLVYGISNLVRNSATRYNGIDFDTDQRKPKANNRISRRMLKLTPEELKIQEQNIGVEQHVIDPKTINEELMRSFQYVSTSSSVKSRHKRSAEKLVHKLIRIPPPNVSEELYSKENQPVDVKLNTSSFAGPYYEPEAGSQDFINSTALSYEQIEDLAFADLNGTAIESNGNDTDDEELPNPEELVAGPRYRVSNKHRLSFAKGESKRKRIPIWSHQVPIMHKKCERFTASMCIKADDYPLEQIMGSIRRHKNAMSALLAEYHDKAAELEYQEQLEEYQFSSKRREDGNVITPGGMCASIVRYARPQKARSASGEWKYIINTGRHTQTLRLEKCSTPQESCSYLSHNYRSRCTQVYNYHRLLSWDKTRGLHVDIFKVPTCCSCQVDGYRETFPPLEGSKHMNFKDYTPVPNNNPYSTINDEIDYEDEDDDDEGPITYQFGSGLKKAKHDNYQHSELLLGSSNIKTKVNPPRLNPTVGSYLSPPSDNYDSQVVTKIVRPSYYTHSNKVHNGRSRMPYKNYIPNESRVDLEISGTEQTNKEVKAYSIQDSTRIPQKRTRVYSGTNNETPYHTSGPIFPSEPVPINYVPTTEQTAKTPHAVLSPSTKGSSSRKEIGNGKRINYNYHPIIDFFESHQKSGKGQQPLRNTATNSIPISSEIITSRDRRIGYGMSGIENSWHPVVVNS